MLALPPGQATTGPAGGANAHAAPGDGRQETGDRRPETGDRREGGASVKPAEAGTSARANLFVRPFVGYSSKWTAYDQTVDDTGKGS